MSKRRFQFEPPTEHYDNRIGAIDEQICGLIKQRKEISSNNPGFPSKQLKGIIKINYPFLSFFN